MDADLIKLVNKLQDTFANLGQFASLCCRLSTHVPRAGGELDMPQLAVVCIIQIYDVYLDARSFAFRLAVSLQESLVFLRRMFRVSLSFTTAHQTG